MSENYAGSKNARGDEYYDSEIIESELVTPAKRKRNKKPRVMQSDGSNEQPSDLGLKNLSDAAKLDSEKTQPVKLALKLVHYRRTIDQLQFTFTQSMRPLS